MVFHVTDHGNQTLKPYEINVWNRLAYLPAYNSLVTVEIHMIYKFCKFF